IPPKASNSSTNADIKVDTRSNQGFIKYLEGSKGRHQAKTIRQYAARFGRILEDGNASELLTLPPKALLHAMSSLAALAKYQGRYNEWKEIKTAYGLKWKYQDDISAFESIT